jgi:hypothetical protein
VLVITFNPDAEVHALSMARPSELSAIADGQLMNRVNGLVVHELGNSLQSLIVLVELTRDELQHRDPSGNGVRRLNRALDSIERLRRMLAASARVRAGLEVSSNAITGRVLTDLLDIVRERLETNGLQLVRETADIDELAAPSRALRMALLTASLAGCEVLRAARRSGGQLVVRGRVASSRMCVDVTTDAGELALGQELLDQLDALLGEDPASGASFDGRDLSLWTAL